MTDIRSGVDLRGITQIALATHDVDRLSRFYRDKLGLTELFNAGGMSFLVCGSIRLMISPPSAAEFDHPSSILYFDVADIEACVKILESQGVEFASEPHCIARMDNAETWNAHFRDPDGNMMALTSSVVI